MGQTAEKIGIVPRRPKVMAGASDRVDLSEEPSFIVRKGAPSLADLLVVLGGMTEGRKGRRVDPETWKVGMAPLVLMIAPKWGRGADPTRIADRARLDIASKRSMGLEFTTSGGIWQEVGEENWNSTDTAIGDRVLTSITKGGGQNTGVREWTYRQGGLDLKDGDPISSTAEDNTGLNSVAAILQNLDFGDMSHIRDEPNLLGIKI